jgi:hypothetical protein
MNYSELPKRRQPPQRIFVTEIKVVRGNPGVDQKTGHELKTSEWYRMVR